MAIADKTGPEARSVTTQAGIASLLAATDTPVEKNWPLDPLVSVSPGTLDLATVLHALSDPVRLQIVSQLATAGEQTCGSLELPVAKSTCSHHFRVLREAGIVAQRVDGKCRYNRLLSDELEQRFPGLLDAVLRAQA
jgi:DNA-binding transcriptional ArsR family regulator